MLLPIYIMSVSPKVSRRPNLVGEWMDNDPVGQDRFERNAQAFASAIRLRSRLALSEFRFELYRPSGFKGRFTDTEPDQWKRRIKYCLSPAILEHPAQAEQKGWAINYLIGAQRVITTTAEEQKREKVAVIFRCSKPMCRVTFTYESGSLLLGQDQTL